MKEILAKIIVRIDDNGKEVEEPMYHEKTDGTKVYTYENAPATIRYKNATEVIKKHLKKKGETTAKGKVTNQGAINEAIKISVEQINKEK